MPELISDPVVVPAAGSPPKTITEFIGRVTTDEGRLSVALMKSPPGWSEPPQRPDFDEFSIVLSGVLVVEHDGGTFEARAGQAVHARPGERVAYSTPEGAEYVAVCLPAFSPDNVHRASD